MTFDDFRSVYAPIIEQTGDDVFEALKKAREVFDLLGGGTELPNKAVLRAVNDKKLTVSDLIYRSDSIIANDGKF